jgi:hypothetical protein
MGLPFFGNTSNKVMVGWNQILKLNDRAVKVQSFNVGIQQEATLPDLIVGLSDRIAFQKGVISVSGNIQAPLTNTLGNILIEAADTTTVGGGDLVMSSSALPSGITLETKIQELTISAQAGEPISLSCSFVGRIKEAGGYSESDFSSGKGTLTNGLIGSVSGNSNWDGAYETEQIPMFDRIVIDPGFLPLENSLIADFGNYIVPVGFSFTINNNIQPNYVLGVGDSSSSSEVGSLNPFSLTYGQRNLSGTMKFQSGYKDVNSKLAVVMNAGRSADNANTGFTIFGSSINSVLNTSPILNISGEAFFPVWDAKPADIQTGDRITYEAAFKLVAKAPGIWSLVTGNRL